ncbi:hypothetical protein DH2020_014341 [Rehmannia glutinosa]|uniref:Aluminum-activated malate transporter n=1 Tax=Rehmannia glutinosa TaxID=99300 RepID=A0ABR0WXI4_REHGL
MEPLFKDIGQNAIWAVMTVVVVLEFTAGATLCKGLNRGLGTLVAGSLAFLIEYIAQESGQWLKILPFSQNSNINPLGHSYRVHNVLQIAHSRFYTVAIGCGICLLMTLFILPNWSGQHLHHSTVSKLEGLAYSIQACVDEYFSNEEPNTAKDKSCEDPIYKGYKAVLDSKSTDETLVPMAAVRQVGRRSSPFWIYTCGSTWISSNSNSDSKTNSSSFQGSMHSSRRRSTQSTNRTSQQHQKSPPVLARDSLRPLTRSPPSLFLGRPNTNIVALASSRHKPSKEFGVSLSSVKTDSSALMAWRSKRAASGGGEREAEAERKVVLRPTLSKIAITSLEFSEALPFAAFASLLVEAVARLDLVIEEVEELGRVANFREFSEGDDKVSVVCQGNAAPLENHLPSHVADC